MGRLNGRALDALRNVAITTGVNPHAEGSCIVKFGMTEVLCTASVQEKLPQWMRASGKSNKELGGWVTAEYGMLPRATGERKDREATRGKQEGRTIEIQRLVGRAIRAVCDLKPLEGKTIWLDCDVLVADGGTRTAVITGSYVALALALAGLEKAGKLRGKVLREQVAAISCGVGTEGVMLDMDYVEDSSTLADGNFVMSSGGHWVEVQVSGEQRPVTAAEVGEMQRLAEKGIQELFQLQREVIEASLV